MRTTRILMGVAGVAALAAVAAGTPAHASAMSVTYYSVSGDPDFNTNPCCNYVYHNEVLPTLGPNGLPVYNSGYGGATLHDVIGTGELTWWSPSLNSHVTQTGTGTVTLPISDGSLFPPNGIGSNDNGDFLTAVYRATMIVPTRERVSFSLGADDDAILAINNTVVAQIGGIHSLSSTGYTTGWLDAGTYTLSLFYADRHVTDAALDFSVRTQNVQLNPVPEPLTLSLFGAGLLGAAMLRRRRKA